MPYCVQTFGQIEMLILLNPRILFTHRRVPRCNRSSENACTAIGIISRIRQILRGHSTDYLHFTCKQSWSLQTFELKYITGNNLLNVVLMRT